MNWVLISALILLIVFAFKGIKDGFIKTVFIMFSSIVAILITMLISPYVSKALQENKQIKGYVTQQIANIINLEETNKSSKQRTLIEELPLPTSLKEILIENNNEEVYKALGTKKFEKYVSSYLASVTINALSFLLVFLFIRLGLIIIANMLDIISKLPIINQLNKTAGFLIGILYGFLVLWLLCIFITMFQSSPVGIEIYKQIEASHFLSSIYNNNLLLKIVTNITKVLF